MQKFKLFGGTLITPEGLREADILLSNGKIEEIVYRNRTVSTDYYPVDCTGFYISPGFVDIHQHGGGGSDYMDDDPDAYYNAVTSHLKHGVTSVMPTLLSADQSDTLRAVRRYNSACNDKRIKSNLLGLHIEGPYLSPFQAGAQKPEHIRNFDEAEYRFLSESAQGNIRRWSVAPELPGVENFAKFAKENRITLSIAHSDADFESVKKAFCMGFKHVTHFYSCISTITRRNGFRILGILEAAYLIEEMNVEIIADGCHLPLDLLQFITKFKNKENIALISDAMRAAGQNVQKSFLGSKDDPLPVIIEDGVAKMENRQAFAGSIATGDRLIRTMLATGISLTEAVNMATANPIRMMHLDVKKGSIIPGYDADLCVFDSDIQIKKVFVGGLQVV